MERGVDTLHVAAESAPEVLAARSFERDADGLPIAEFGNERIMKIPRNVINILPQIRRDFDPAKLQELADSMPLAEDEAGLKHELMEPLVEGLHTEESACVYLEQFNRANGTDFTVEGLIPYKTPNGTRYVIHIAGERRIRAGDILIEKYGYSPESRFLCSVHENITYVDALPKQFIENNARVQPSFADEARAMSGYISMMREIEPKYTQKECAGKFAVSPDRVHNALVFDSYPSFMQQHAERYPFSWVIEAEDIYKAWLKYYNKYKYGKKDPNKIGLLAEDEEEEPDGPHDEKPIWIISDGKALTDSSPEEAASCEVEICFMKMKTEALDRRTSQRENRVRKRKDVSLRKQLELILKAHGEEVHGIGQGEITDAWDGEDREELLQEAHRRAILGEDKKEGEDEPLRLAETYIRRRKIAAANLFEAVFNAIWLLDARGDLSTKMRERIAKFAVTEVLSETIDSEMEAAVEAAVDAVTQEAELFEFAG